MANEPEVIRQQMEDTRTDLSDKLETLESEFADSVHHMTDSVTGTVQSVKDSVDDTVATVKETVHDTLNSVKSAFDVSHQVDQHPWLMLGGAVAVGYVGGCVLANLDAPSSGPVHAGGSYDPTYHAADSVFGSAEHKQSSTSHFLGEMAEKFQPEIAQLKGLAIGAALSLLRDFVSRSLPVEARRHVAETVDGFTTKLGGKPMHGLLPEEAPKQPSSVASARAGQFAG